MVPTDGKGSFCPSSFAGIGGAVGPLNGGRRSDGVLLDGSALNVLSLKSLGLPRWRLSICWDRWLELRWLEWVSERISPETGVLPSRSGMIYGTGPLLLLPFLLEDILESFLVWAIV
jgi:hypothetical protein